jgi:16S rRNA U516 pseudouridylate synthase RsuA-like enzyme
MSAIEKLRAGVVITTTQQRDGETTTGLTLPCSVDVIRKRGDGKFATLRFELREGRNRQIRKMCDAVGVDVTRLHRVSVGEVSLDESSLEVGGVRALSGDELDAIGAAVLASKGRGGGSRDVGTPRVGRVGGGEWGNTRRGGGWGAEIAAERGKY